MARLLALLMILALVVTQGSAAASAVCRHSTAQDHIFARQSADLKVAAVATGEEAAVAVVSKKSPQAPDLAGHSPAEMLLAESAPRLFAAKDIRSRAGPETPLPSTTVVPLLKPPSA